MARLTTHTLHTAADRDVTVRLADSGDSRALLRLASLDSAAVPARPVVVAETGGEMLAAVPVAGGAAIADPFHRTTALVEMLELRAAQLRDAAPAEKPGSLGRRLLALARDPRPLPFLP